MNWPIIIIALVIGFLIGYSLGKEGYSIKKTKRK